MDTLKDLAKSLIILLYHFNCLGLVGGVSLLPFFHEQLFKKVDELMVVFNVLAAAIFVLNLRNHFTDFIEMQPKSLCSSTLATF